MESRNASQKISHFFEEKVVCPCQELISFFKQYLVHPDVIGAMTPSSSFVAKAIIEPLRKCKKNGRRILEIGAGTGVITKYLLELLQPGDRLDVIEFVPELVIKLRQMIESSDKKDQVFIYEKRIEEFSPSAKYDHVVSGLPLTSFPKELVQKFYTKLDQEFLADQGLFSYYEYLWINQLRLGCHQLFRKREKHQRLYSILQMKRSYLKGKNVHAKKVWLNFTPMCVVHVPRR